MIKELKTRIQSLIDKKENWETNNPILLDKEIAYIEDENNNLTMKIGDGATAFNELPARKVNAPNWNENDSTAPGYIEGRTHYKDWIEVVPETLATYYETDQWSSCDGYFLYNFSEGQKCKVIVDTAEYLVTSTVENGQIVLTVTGEFIIGINPINNYFIAIFMSTSQNTVFKIDVWDYVQIDPKFVPNLPYKDYDNLIEEIFFEEIPFEGDYGEEGKGLGLIPNDNYRINFNYGSYDAVCKTFIADSQQYNYIGNLVLLEAEGVEDTGETYLVVEVPNLAYAIIDSSEEEKTSVSIFHLKPTIHKLNNDFLDAEWIAKSNIKIHLAESTPSKETNGDLTETFISIIGEDNILKENKNYIIIYNGKEYNCILEKGNNSFISLKSVSLENLLPATFNGFVLENDGVKFQTFYISNEIEPCLKIGIYSKTNNPILQRFLPEGYPYLTEIPTVFLEEQTLSGSEGTFQLPNYISLEEDKKYSVIYNGMKYQLIAKSTEMSGETVYYLGNLYLFNSSLENTEEPFIIGSIPSNNMSAIMIEDTTLTEITLQINSTINKIDKLDNKYLDLDWIPKLNKTDEEIILYDSSTSELPLICYPLFENQEIIFILDGLTYTSKVKKFNNDDGEGNNFELLYAGNIEGINKIGGWEDTTGSFPIILTEYMQYGKDGIFLMSKASNASINSIIIKTYRYNNPIFPNSFLKILTLSEDPYLKNNDFLSINDRMKIEFTNANAIVKNNATLFGGGKILYSQPGCQIFGESGSFYGFSGENFYRTLYNMNGAFQPIIWDIPGVPNNANDEDTSSAEYRYSTVKCPLGMTSNQILKTISVNNVGRPVEWEAIDYNQTYITTTEPESPLNGSVWFDPVALTLKVRYEDTWVEFISGKAEEVGF